MRALILLTTLTLVAFGVVASSHARNCQTNCSQGYGSGSSYHCTTYCN